jgi:hypothetical protein
MQPWHENLERFFQKKNDFNGESSASGLMLKVKE